MRSTVSSIVGLVLIAALVVIGVVHYSAVGTDNPDLTAIATTGSMPTSNAQSDVDNTGRQSARAIVDGYAPVPGDLESGR